jgi:glucose-6-phosphate 1-dehydrogenase
MESKEAYEKLLEDAILSDKTLFTSWEMLEESWRIVDDLVNCKNNCPVIYKYEKGSNGPKESDYLLENYGRKWYG